MYWDWEEYDHTYQVDTGDALEFRREKKKRKQLKFLLLPNAISPEAYHRAHMALCAAYSNGAFQKGQPRCERAAIRNQTHRRVVSAVARSRGYFNVRTAPALDNPELLAGLYDLFKDMDGLVEDAVPDDYDYVWKRAMTALRPSVRDSETNLLVDEDDLSRITDEHAKAIVKALGDVWEMTYTIRGTIFSTAELNRNIIFKSHEDEGNIPGTCVCIAALGTFVR